MTWCGESLNCIQKLKRHLVTNTCSSFSHFYVLNVFLHACVSAEVPLWSLFTTAAWPRSHTSKLQAYCPNLYYKQEQWPNVEKHWVHAFYSQIKHNCINFIYLNILVAVILQQFLCVKLVHCVNSVNSGWFICHIKSGTTWTWDVPAQKQLLLVLRIAQDEVFLPVRILFFLSNIA